MRILAAALAVSMSFGYAAAPAKCQQRGGQLVYGVSADPPTFDCGASDTFAVIHSVAPFYSLLLKIDLARYPEVAGDLAKSWKISDDGKTFTFKLHEGVTFHDGSPLTSADVKASYERYRDPPQGVVSFLQAALADIDAIETPDDTTMIFRLKAPNPAMLISLASPQGCIYSAGKLAEDPNFPAKNILGSGPFKFLESVKGGHVAGIRNDAYFRKGLPYLDGFKAVVFSQSAAIINALEGNQILAEFRAISPADKDRLASAMGKKIQFYESDWSALMLIVFNVKKPPFNDIRVRQALSLALDRDLASRGLQKTSLLRSVGGIIRPGAQLAMTRAELASFPGFGGDAKAAREQALRLLKEAGVAGLKVVLFNRSINQPYTPAGVFVIDQWRRIGVTAEHRQVETAQYREAIRSGNFDVAIDYTNAILEDPSLTLTRYVSGSPDNPSGSADAEIDALFEQQKRETDPQKRRVLVKKLEARVLTQAYQTPLLWWRRTVALNARVRGWRMSPSHFLGQDLAEVWLEPAK
jgi:peptide/nickel transport system substrate-binding protein